MSAIYIGGNPPHFTARCLLLNKIWEYDGTNKLNGGANESYGCSEPVEIPSSYQQAITGIIQPSSKYQHERKLETLFYLKN